MATRPAHSALNEADRRFTQETGLAGEIAALAEPVLEEFGLRLVRVLVSARDGGTVQIMIDHPDRDVTVEDCADVSRALSPLLDAHDPIPGRYHLEVSSPGIDRPLVRPSDFDEWAGQEVKLMLREPIDGRKRFRGVIDGHDAERQEIRLAVVLDGKSEPEILGFPVSLIESAKLVMTDALMAEAKARRGGSEDEDPNAPNGED